MFGTAFRSQEHKQIKINVVDGTTEEVNQAVYLGVRIDNQLKWQQQIDYVCKKRACASYALLKWRFFSPTFTLKTVKLSTVVQCFSNLFVPSPPFHSRHIVFDIQA